jgi:hypothetical protein
MTKEFELTDEEFDAIKDISQSRQPVIWVGVWLGMDAQERANSFWEQLGEKHGFVWDTARPVSGKSNRFFTAETK